jgi:hypothetical protein
MDKRVTDVTGDELLARLHSRKDFLRLMGAAGIGAAAGANVLPGAAEGAVRTRLEPTDFSFTTREIFRPFHLLAPNFVELDDDFDGTSPATYTPLRPGGPEEDDGAYAASDGKMRFSESTTPESNDYYTILKSNTGEVAPFITVIVEVTSLPDGAVYAGLYRDEGNYVHVYYNKDTNTVGIEARVNGVLYELGSTAVEAGLFATPFRFAFVANENEVTALVGDASSEIGDWRPIIKRDVKTDFNDPGATDDVPTGLDLRRVDVLATYKNGFGARSSTGSTIAFERVLAGYYGEAGVRDPHAVQYADGTPYIKNNKLYFTLTNAGLGFFEKAHWGVWTMDLSNYRNIEQVGNIFWRNVDDDDPLDPGDPLKVYGHHAGQIILDEEKDRWIVVVSSWGDFGPQGGDRALTPGTVTQNPANPPVDILYDERPSTEDILHEVHVLDGKEHPVNSIPFRTEGKWDPGLTRIDGRWYLSYVIALDLFTDFQPALARSISDVADHTQLEFVGADWEKRATEGPIIQKLGGQWRLFASSGDDEPPEFEDKYPIYFLEAENPTSTVANRRLRFDGNLDAPHPTNIPHPMIVPIPIKSRKRPRRRTKYIMITFNGEQYYERLLGYGTHGHFYVMQAEQTVRGWEFPRR